ncbi:MAG: thiamine diphosphokinase [Bdellovibrionales bacterium]|nr:thiamine diphosphokinase [Bdellovibrionales bacterium]
MRTLLVGPLLVEAPLPRDFDRVVAVDGGLDFCARQRLPVDWAIGDWDSLRNPKLLQNIPAVTLPAQKDRSDFYAALQCALIEEPAEIVAMGFVGGRIDHQLAVMADAHRLLRDTPTRFELRADEASLHHVSARRGAAHSWRVRRGDLVSLLPIGESVEGLRLEGLKYAPKNGKLTAGSHGLSNVATKAKILVRLRRGSLWLILPSAMLVA